MDALHNVAMAHADFTFLSLPYFHHPFN